MNIVFVDGAVHDIISTNRLNAYGGKALGIAMYKTDLSNFGWSGGRWQ